MPIACSDNTSYAMDGYYSSNQGYQFEVGSSGYIITGWQYLAATGGGTVAMQVLSDQTIGSESLRWSRKPRPRRRRRRR